MLGGTMNGIGHWPSWGLPFAATGRQSAADLLIVHLFQSCVERKRMHWLFAALSGMIGVLPFARRGSAEVEFHAA